ncbi:RNA-guided endonuclease InsQ/TnpB family protein [Brevibacillus sp. NRS-1366]|uniref:RNA-guided endonuclease InsQ/TnpB family protein n=1 Tax=Brevibacillus sp. NRS-1366 TaxID=3233899 RepID=UPI003D25FF25
MQITYQFRLYPTPEQVEKMNRTLELLRRLYNAAKEQREIAYKQFGQAVFYSMQQSELPVLKTEFPSYKEIHSQVIQDCLRRLDDAFLRFFRREAGYPRFKSRDKYLSFTYPQHGTIKKTFAEEGYIYLSKIGHVKMNAHRNFDRAKVTQINVKRYADKWMTNIQVKVEETETVSRPEKVVGIDLGLSSFATLSNETIINTPRYLRKAEKRLKRYQRRHSRKQKASSNREKSRQKVAKAYQQVARQRRDFLHKQSSLIVRDHDLIAVEQLKIKNMLRNRRLAKSIFDAGWSQFITYLSYKAKRQGKRFVKVPAHGTSQICLCGADVPKTLSVRIHECLTCGIIQDRDLVSAKVILQRAMSLIA